MKQVHRADQTGGGMAKANAERPKRMVKVPIAAKTEIHEGINQPKREATSEKPKGVDKSTFQAEGS